MSWAHQKRCHVGEALDYRNHSGNPRRLASGGDKLTLRRPRLRGLAEQFYSRLGW